MSLSLARYDAACAALADAVTANEIMQIRVTAQTIEAVARAAGNFEFEIKGAKLRTLAEARLGDMLNEGERTGIIVGHGGKRRGEDQDSATNLEKPATLKEIGVPGRLAAHARRLSGIGQQAVDAMLARFETESHECGKPAFEVIHQALSRRNAKSRRDLARELSDASEPLCATGRKFPVLYADPAWRRKAGIGDRAYENNYVTMAWADILAMPVANRLLNDAWGFVWIPRAHLLALVEVEIDTPLGRCEMKIPLAFAIQIKWGFDNYSTCAVWTKTDEEFPDDHGTGLMFFDQDELLLVYKRGRGLPKPDTDKKFGSNHRERSGRHSEKPAFYRDMINAMTGDLPVLELFAREDDEHVLPPNFYTWGNQSQNSAEVAVPVDASGTILKHSPDTGEVIETEQREGEDKTEYAEDHLDIPPFLRRPRDGQGEPAHG